MSHHHPNPEDSYPTKEGDLIKEMTIALVFVTIVITVLAFIFKAPFKAPVSIQQVATNEPVLFEQTAMRDLMSTSAIATYGPPYNSGQAQQALGWFSPEQWGGVSVPIHASTLYVLTPLKNASAINPAIQSILSEFESASAVQKAQWENNYYHALQNATETAAIRANATNIGTAETSTSIQAVSVPNGNYGPVAPMMNYLLGLGRSGFMDSSLNAGSEYNNKVYTYNFSQSLLFLQGQALHRVAAKKHLLGEQLGIAKDLSPYPGPWWLFPYSYLYQIPPYSTAAAGDLFVALTMVVVFLILLFLPFIPILNRIPYYVPVYKIIWRRWYKNQDKGRSKK